MINQSLFMNTPERRLYYLNRMKEF